VVDMTLMRVPLLIGLVLASVPLSARSETAAQTAAPAEVTPAQPVTLADLEGAKIEIGVLRQQVVRREGRQFPVTIQANWTLLIDHDGVIDQTFTSTAHGPRGPRQAKPRHGSFVLDQVRELGSLGGGQGMWRLQDGTLTFVRTLKDGAYRNTITLARGSNGITCTANEAFAREKGTGPIAFNSSFDDRPTVLVSAKQVSSTCRISRRE